MSMFTKCDCCGEIEQSTYGYGWVHCEKYCPDIGEKDKLDICPKCWMKIKSHVKINDGTNTLVEVEEGKESPSTEERI